MYNSYGVTPGVTWTHLIYIYYLTYAEKDASQCSQSCNHW